MAVIEIRKDFYLPAGQVKNIIYLSTKKFTCPKTKLKQIRKIPLVHLITGNVLSTGPHE